MDRTPARDAFFVEPWGALRPRGVRALLISIAHRLPTNWFGARLGFLLRRMARWRLGHPLDVRLWGVRLRLFPRGNITEARLLFMPRLWDVREREAIMARLAPGTVFVDVGANVGAYSWFVWSRLGNDCRILALEPDPELARALEWHIEQNEADALEVARVAVGGEPGVAELRIHGSNRGQNTLDASRGGSGADHVRTHIVEVMTLDGLLRARGFDRVDVLKIDIEGLEWDVLSAFFRDAPEALWPRLLLTEHSDSESHRRLATLLEECGYRLVDRTKMNLILAFAPGETASAVEHPELREDH